MAVDRGCHEWAFVGWPHLNVTFSNTCASRSRDQPNPEAPSLPMDLQPHSWIEGAAPPWPPGDCGPAGPRLRNCALLLTDLSAWNLPLTEHVTAGGSCNWGVTGTVSEVGAGAPWVAQQVKVSLTHDVPIPGRRSPDLLDYPRGLAVSVTAGDRQLWYQPPRAHTHLIPCHRTGACSSPVLSSCRPISPHRLTCLRQINETTLP